MTITLKGTKTKITKTCTIKNATISVKNVKTKITKKVGSKSFTLKPKVTLKGKGKAVITYKSNKTTVAKVGKSNGKVVIKKAGKAVITIQIKAKNHKTITKKVTINVKKS